MKRSRGGTEQQCKSSNTHAVFTLMSGSRYSSEGARDEKELFTLP